MVGNSIWAVPSNTRALDRTIERAIDDFFGPYLMGRASRTAADEYLPALDVWENEENYGIQLDVPGFTMDRLDVTVHGNELTITGARAPQEVSSSDTKAGEGKVGEVKCCGGEKAEKCACPQYRHRERENRHFRRQVTLPEAVNAETVTAELANGVLTVILPKLEQAKVRKIQVRAHQ